MADLPTQLQQSLADRYRLERELGRGGMATVYLAHDLKHDRDVAIKVLRPELAAALGTERFLAEIRVSARLDHPHILTLIDSGSADGTLYYVLPFVRGESLRQRLTRETQMRIEEAVAITTKLAGALDYAHRQGVIHRDIKPENILLQEGEPILADFGIALAVKEAGGNRLTETGLSLGTPMYMSPEQATGERALDARSDVYSLGAVLYEMLTGEPPHTGPSAQAIVARIMLQPPTPPRVLRSSVPPAVERAVLTALSVLPADRFPTAAAFAAALSAPAESASALAADGRAPVGRRRQAVLIGGAALALGGIAVATVLTLRSKEPAPVQPIQLTSSGHAYAPVVSPDGSQVAYVAEECRSETECTSSLMVRETASQVERPIVTGLLALFPFQWSRDGLWLLYNGTDNRRPIGLYVVSRLGGPPTYLSDGVANFLGAGDTVVTRDAGAGRPGEPIHLQLRVPPWAHVVDSIAVTPPAGGYMIGAVRMTASGRRMALAWNNALATSSMVTLADRSGKRTDTLTAYGANFLRWAAGEKAILLPISYVGGSGVAAGRLLRVAVSPAGMFGRRDTLVIAPGVASTAIYDLSTDARSFVFQSTRAGETKVSAWTVRPGAPATGPRVIASSSRYMYGMVTRDGRSVVYDRRTAAGNAETQQWMVAPFDSGAARAITPPLADVVDYTLTDQQLIVATGPAGGPVALTAYDLADGKATHLADLKELKGGLLPGPRDRLVVVSTAGDSVRMLDTRGQELWRIGIPDSLGRVNYLLPSPDGSDLVTITQPVSIVAGEDGNLAVPIVRIAAATGALRVARWLRLQNFVTHVWSDDDWLYLGIQRAGESDYRSYRLRLTGGEPQLVGRMPPGSCSVSGDARRWLCTRTEYLSDIYLLRFPRALR